jgi:hypothetical protein
MWSAIMLVMVGLHSSGLGLTLMPLSLASPYHNPAVCSNFPSSSLDFHLLDSTHRLVQPSSNCSLKYTVPVTADKEPTTRSASPLRTMGLDSTCGPRNRLGSGPDELDSRRVEFDTGSSREGREGDEENDGSLQRSRNTSLQLMAGANASMGSLFRLPQTHHDRQVCPQKGTGDSGESHFTWASKRTS